MVKKDCLTAKELAYRWGWNVGSLANQRLRKRGPKYETIGRTVLYYISEVIRYETAHPEVFKPRSKVS
jgi:hypothetical protein